ncbi:serine-threonine protein kinase 19-domain-containing protein [Truncatella angustata]|uniref:Serine-threonine protein kinase 19-domain-containing protein n=1 Tax=Truncatella angustata TaxID=152316 RepID=A0A9P9A3B7_9PEZI|nr:serine-threonine protein kinase 19-domain-containing protein [Truncatella angustata]KAH6659988.1 serine-threonine protein kinase 19-domain-containing protein [Truncatella angustata]
MPSLSRILGGPSRVRKHSAKPRSLPFTKTSKSSPRKKSTGRRYVEEEEEEEEEDYFGDEKLQDLGLVHALATDPNLRDTAQALQYLRAHMFDPIPQQGAGMNSTRIAETLNYRKHLSPLVTITHISTLLSSPSAVEREVAELMRSGFIRKIEVAKRGEIGETLILATDLERTLDEAPQLSETTRTQFKAFLQENPITHTVPRKALPSSAVDELFKAGFLTSQHTNTSSLSNMMNTYSRPEDKSTLVSIENVSKQATGSLGAVGGVGAVHMAGGSGGGARLPANATELQIAVPGNGTFLKLVSSALDHLVSLLGKSRFREAPEGMLRERWNGGVAKDEAVYMAKKSRGEFAGILPGQTRKWKQFRGLSFDWILQEAVGSGLIEIFETGTVGRGIRVI